MTTPQRFGDNEYKNWLKCSLALMRCKESLHPFVDTEVKKFHADIQKQIGAISGSQCNSCTSKSIQHSRGVQGVWNISCKNNICDRWLQEILRKHDDPKNRNINWKNADIRRWPTDGYEVAKVYMPKGQEKTKKLPEDFDPSAVLSLFKYCKWFKIKVPNTAIVSELIEIRNELFHSRDFKVMDNKKDICIDNTTQLLSVLGINGNVVSELQQLKLEDIDINYRETEVKVFNTILSALNDEMKSLLADQIQHSGDLDTVKAAMSFLQAKQTQQGQEMQEIKFKTTQTSGKVVNMETDIKAVKKELEQKRQHFQKMKSFFENNPDIDDQNITKNILEIEKIVNDLQCRVLAKEKDISELKTRMSSLESRQDRIEKKIAEMDENWEKKQPAFELQKEFEHLRDELLSRYKSLRTIPISPFDENEEVFTPDNFYTDIVIKYEDKERKMQEQAQSPVSCKHLFEGRERIILTGVAGSGKSTYCRKLVNRWYKLQEDKKIAAGKDDAGPSTHDSLDLTDLGTDDTSHVLEQSTSTHETSVEEEPLPDFSHMIKQLSNDTSDMAGPSTQDSSHVVEPLTNDSSDEDLLKFDLLFYIYSHVLSNSTNLVELLCNQCLKRELKREKAEIQQVISKLLIHQPEKILIIFDGLDELEHIPDFLVDLFRRCLHPRVTVLMGMRRWQIYRLGLKATSHYDLLLDIQGFSPDNALKFVKKVIDLNNAMYKQTKYINIDNHVDIILSFKKIPLLLLFLAHILYLKQCLPDKCRNLYNQILDCLIERCLRKSGNNYFEPRKVQENIDHCSEMFREKYLNSACKVAHHFLLTREGGVSVVISEKELKQELGDDANMKLSALLDCGIISKEDFFSPLEKNISVTFLHTSVQEYLASIHLVQNEDAFQSFLQSLKTLNDVLKYENLFIFVCGLDAGQGHKAFIRICQVCDVDPYVLKYRQGKDDDDDDDSGGGGGLYFKVEDDIKSLNEMYKACIDEMDTHDPLEIPDIFAWNDEWYKLVMSRQISCYVKSLNLTSLALWCLSLSEEQSRSLCNSISSFTHLEKLQLDHITLTDGVLDLSNLHDLTSLTLGFLDISEMCNKSLFSTVSACTKLQKLELYDTTLTDGVLDLHELTCLNSVQLHHVIVSEENCGLQFCCIIGIAQLEKLEKLDLLGMKLCMRQHDGLPEPSKLMKLRYIRLEVVMMCPECSRSICSIISGCGQLRKLELDTVKLHDGTLDLSTLINLTSLSLLKVSMLDECSRSLCSSISGCTHLKSFILWDATLNDGILDLSSKTHLTTLTLYNVIMYEQCSRCLCLCISSGIFSHMKKLHLEYLMLHDGVLDFKTLTSLTELKLHSLTISEECTKSLCNSIGVCTNLKCLELIGITLRDCVLDLKTMASLTDLILVRVTMSEKCTKALCNSISACTNLEILKLRNISLHNTVLDLKKLRNLRRAEFISVTMSSKCKNILNKSKKHCPELTLDIYPT